VPALGRAASAVPLLDRLTPLLLLSMLLSRPPCMLIMSSCSCTGGEVKLM
jgi:hypothetical protein